MVKQPGVEFRLQLSMELKTSVGLSGRIFAETGSCGPSTRTCHRSSSPATRLPPRRERGQVNRYRLRGMMVWRENSNRLDTENQYA